MDWAANEPHEQHTCIVSSAALANGRTDTFGIGLLRFYCEIAGDVGVRVPTCHEAVETSKPCRLVLEDIPAWRDGRDLVPVARVLRQLSSSGWKYGYRR